MTKEEADREKLALRKRRKISIIILSIIFVIIIVISIISLDQIVFVSKGNTDVLVVHVDIVKDNGIYYISGSRP